MSAARFSRWCPTTPGRKTTATGCRSPNPASVANRSRTRRSSAASTGVTSAFSGGEATRYALPEVTGTGRGPASGAGRGDIAVGLVKPEAADQAAAHDLHRLHRVGRVGRLRVHLADDQLDRRPFFQPDRDREAAGAPGVHDTIQLLVRKHGLAVLQEPPGQAARPELGWGLGVQVRELGEVQQLAAVLRRQGVPGQHAAARELVDVEDAGDVEILRVERDAAGRAPGGRRRLLTQLPGLDRLHRAAPSLLSAERRYLPRRPAGGGVAADVGVPGAPSTL